MGDELRVSGTVPIPEELAKGDEVAVLVMGTVVAIEDKTSATRGDELVHKVKMNSAIIATGAEETALKERLAAERAKRKDEQTGQVNLLEEGGDEDPGADEGGNVSDIGGAKGAAPRRRKAPKDQ